LGATILKTKKKAKRLHPPLRFCVRQLSPRWQSSVYLDLGLSWFRRKGGTNIEAAVHFV
jgi:hypothetical protein